MTRYASARLGASYRLVVPKEVRKALSLRPHDKVLFLIEGNSVYMLPCPQNFTDKLSGLHADVWSNTDEWLQNERSTWNG